MFPSASITALIFLAVDISASPIIVRRTPISLPFARHLNITGAQDVVRKDKARARDWVSVSKASAASSDAAGSVGVTNTGVIYQASVGVGSPPTQCE